MVSIKDIDSEAAKLGISKKDILALSDRNENGIITDSRWLLMMNISMVESRVFENEMLNKLVAALDNATAREKSDLSEYFIFDNPIIGNYKTDGRPKRKYDEQSLPDGYRKVHYFENGIDKYIIVQEEAAKQLLDLKENKITPFLDKLSEDVPILGWLIKNIVLTPATLLRFFATGGNPFFILGNVPMDWTNAVFFSDTYSDIKLIGMAQAGVGFGKNFLKKIWKDFNQTVLKGDVDKVYLEFAEHGGLMDTMSQEGLRSLEKLKPKGKILGILPKKIRPTAKFAYESPYKVLKAYGTGLSYLGETSEVAFRLAVYEKSKKNLIKEFKKNNKNINPNSKQLDDIMWQAAREARELIDFKQGGSWAKEMDVFMPYFNAAMQGVRRPIDFARKNPKKFAFSMLQLGTMAGTLVGWSVANALAAFDDDDEEDRKKKVKKALDSISTYEKANFHIVFTGNINKDGELEYYRVKKLPVASIITTLAESLMYKAYLGYDIDYENTKKAFEQSTPISPTEMFSKNPLVAGGIAYYFNKDLFTGEEVFRKPKGKDINPSSEGLYDDRIEGVYKYLGTEFGLSPARSKAFVEKIITTESTNPTINLIYAAANGVFDKNSTFGKEFSVVKDEMLKQSERKFLRYTNKNLIEYQKEDELKQKERDIETEIYNKEQKVKSEIKRKYDAGGKMSIDDIVKIVDKNFDEIDRERYYKKFYTYINNRDADPTLLDLMYEDNYQVQAMKLFERYGNQIDADAKKEIVSVMNSSGMRLNKKAIYLYKTKYKGKIL